MSLTLYKLQKEIDRLKHEIDRFALIGSQRGFIHARRSLVAAYPLPRFPQNVTPVDPVIQRMEPPCPTLLGTHP
jgi:hypothetical protein